MSFDFSRPNIALLVLMLFVSSCGERKPAVPRNPSDLTIRAASNDPVPLWTALKFSDPTQGEIYVAPTAALTLDDIESGRQTKDEFGRTAISIHFTAAGAEKMRKFSSERIGQLAAIVFKDKVMNAPMVRSEISSSAIISSGASGLSGEEAEHILAIIYQK